MKGHKTKKTLAGMEGNAPSSCGSEPPVMLLYYIPIIFQKLVSDKSCLDEDSPDSNGVIRFKIFPLESGSP